jgi:hypothetical protein
MRLFRSEEHVPDRSQGAIVALPQLERLAAAWYGDRLDPGWRPRTHAASQAVLQCAGLTGDFWRLP